MTETKAYPAGKQAAKQFAETNFPLGEVIPRSWFYAAFDIEQPMATTPYKRASQLELAFLNQFKIMEKHLRDEYCIVLEVVRTEGYRIIPPKEQAKHGYTKTVNGIVKSIKDGMDIITSVDRSKLTNDDERREQAEYQARMSQIAELHLRRQRRLPPPASAE